MVALTPIMVPIKDLHLEPGSAIAITNLSWEQYEALLTEPNKQVGRMAYFEGTLEIMSPLPAHERPHRLIGKIVEILLDAEERDWEDFGSTTFKRKAKKVGLEPDTCFYIHHAQAVRNCRLAMDVDQHPPPDLAIESDVTSKTTLAVYQLLQVPEVWIYERGLLTIYLLQDDEYQIAATSPTFPQQAICELIPQLLERAWQEGSSKVLREFRQQQQR